MTEKCLLIIDGFNLLSRAYFATSYNRPVESLEKNENGIPVNGMNVFLRKLHSLLSQYNATHCVVTWDIPREETFRRQLYPPYKQTRNELPEPLIQQYELVKKELDSLSIAQLTLSPYEADDLMGSISKKWTEEAPQAPAYIYSNDKDLFQLIDKQVSQIIAAKKQDIVMDYERFIQTYEVKPEQWVDVKALLGDSSDNIPGCPGVGEKTALPLIQAYTTLELLFHQLDDLDPRFNRVRKKLATGKEMTLLSKELSAIKCDIESLPAISSFERSQVSLL